MISPTNFSRLKLNIIQILKPGLTSRVEIENSTSVLNRDINHCILMNAEYDPNIELMEVGPTSNSTWA